MKYSLLKIYREVFWVILFLGSFLLIAPQVQAQVVITDGALTAEFESIPLFGNPDETNIAPSHTSSKSVMITNTGTVPEAVIVSVTNQHSTGLASAVLITITDSNTGDMYFSDTMSNFFLDIPVALGVLGAGNSRSYDISTKFADVSANIYQGSTMGFDIHFGFASGASVTPPPGGGGGGSTPGTPNPTTPPGQVAGDATSTESSFGEVPTWWSPFINWVGETILGATSPEDIDIKGEFIDDEIRGVLGTTDSIDSESKTESDQESCLLTWLLLFALIALVASSIDDLWRHKGKVFRNLYIKQVLFLFMYVLAVGLAFITGWLGSIWYLLVGAWVVMQVYDYLQHAKEWMIWKSFGRLLTYGIFGLILTGAALLFDWPCVWWPFAIILVASIGAYIFGER
jgi:hypothetical protein